MKPMKTIEKLGLLIAIALFIFSVSIAVKEIFNL